MHQGIRTGDEGSEPRRIREPCFHIDVTHTLVILSIVFLSSLFMKCMNSRLTLALETLQMTQSKPTLPMSTKLPVNSQRTLGLVITVM